MSARAEPPAARGPVSVIEQLLANNAAYAAAFDHGGLHAPPQKRLAVVACMDARLDPLRVLGLDVGDAHVLGNAGGVVTDDVIRSLVISQRLLGTRSILLLHHTDCGMTAVDEKRVNDDILAETGIRLPFALEAFTDVETDVRHSMGRILASPFILHKDDVRGFVYQVEDGRMREVQPGTRSRR